MKVLNEDPGRKIYSLLKELNTIFNKNLREYLEGWNITAQQIMVLSLLRERGEMKISEIAYGMDLADSNISGIVDRLEHNGLVERMRSLKDRRIVKVRLTGKAEDMIKDLDTDIGKYFSHIIDRFTESELDGIITSIEMLRDKLKN